MPNACSSAVATCWLVLPDSVPVWTCHSLSSRVEMCCTVASPPPASVTTREISLWVVDAVAGNWKIEPPLNSTLKFSPCTSSATTQTSRMMPEIVYHIRWRPTKLTETSPR